MSGPLLEIKTALNATDDEWAILLPKIQAVQAAQQDIERGRLSYPGPMNVEHAWAYLPDFAATLVRLAEQRANFGPYETFGFPGHAVSGHDFTFAIKKAMRRDFEVKMMSWWLIHTLRSIVPMSRELSEMAYLWQEPHAIAGGLGVRVPA